MYAPWRPHGMPVLPDFPAPLEARTVAERDAVERLVGRARREFTADLNLPGPVVRFAEAPKKPTKRKVSGKSAGPRVKVLKADDILEGSEAEEDRPTKMRRYLANRREPAPPLPSRGDFDFPGADGMLRDLGRWQEAKSAQERAREELLRIAARANRQGSSPRSPGALTPRTYEAWAASLPDVVVHADGRVSPAPGAAGQRRTCKRQRKAAKPRKRAGKPKRGRR